MKVIDLLNKIANGEDTPNRFIYNGKLFEKYLDKYYENYENADYEHEFGVIQFIELLSSDYSNLNDEIEIIEDTPKENNKITKWGKYVIEQDVKKCNQKDLRTYISLLMETQNEIIDYLDYLKSKG